MFPYVKDALQYLSLTQQGQQIVANLYSNVFMVEHDERYNGNSQMKHSNELVEAAL